MNIRETLTNPATSKPMKSRAAKEIEKKQRWERHCKEGNDEKMKETVNSLKYCSEIK